MALAVWFLSKRRNAGDVIFFNTTLAIVVLFIIGLIAGNLWKEIVYILGAVAVGSNIIDIIKQKIYK